MRRLAVVLALVTLTACASEQRGTGDSPVEPVHNQNNEPAHIITFPDGFSNVAVKCDSGDGVYVTTRDAAPVIIVNDPACVR